MAQAVTIKVLSAMNRDPNTPPFDTDIETVTNEFLSTLSVGNVLSVSVVPYSQYGNVTAYLSIVTYKTNV